MRFRFDKITKEDLRLVGKNLYIRVDNVWYLFVKNAKEFDFDTVYGEGVFIEALIKNSDYAKKLFAEIENILSEMNGEALKLMSANRYAVRSETNFGLPDTVEYEDTDEVTYDVGGDGYHE